MKRIVHKFVVVILMVSMILANTICIDVSMYAKTKNKVQLNKTSITMRVGDKVKLKLKKVKAKKVKWTSSNKEVAKVTQKGVVKALKKGKATIRAKYKNKKYKCKIKVKKNRNTPNNQVKQNVDLVTLNQSEYLIDNLYEDKNIVVSPLSLNMVLGMAANGATDVAKKDVETYLGKSIAEYNAFALELSNRDKSDEMVSIANGIWYDQDISILSDFSNAVINNYSAQVKPTPLDETTVTDINQWASDNTDGMIKEIINEIPKETVAILVNALLFDGKWTRPFEAINTYEDEFSKLDSTKVKVEMMHGKEYTYYENDYATGFEKTYGKNKEYSFIAVLPKEEVDFKLSDLDLESFLKSKSTKYHVSIGVPKFSYEWNACLNDTLEKTSLKSLYNWQINPLGNMLDTPNEVYASVINQSCKIIVDEEGTKAAAVTSMIVYEASAIIDDKLKKEVILDRPFGYIIVDNISGQVLFMGKVIDPTQQ